MTLISHIRKPKLPNLIKIAAASSDLNSETLNQIMLWMCPGRCVISGLVYLIMIFESATNPPVEMAMHAIAFPKGSLLEPIFACVWFCSVFMCSCVNRQAKVECKFCFQPKLLWGLSALWTLHCHLLTQLFALYHLCIFNCTLCTHIHTSPIF